MRSQFASRGGAEEDDLLRLCDLDDAPDDIVQCALRDVRQVPEQFCSSDVLIIMRCLPSLPYPHGLGHRAPPCLL